MMMVDHEFVHDVMVELCNVFNPDEAEIVATTISVAKKLLKHNSKEIKTRIVEEDCNMGKSKSHVWQWKINLAGVMAKGFQCMALEIPQGFTLVGRPTNVVTLKLVHVWVVDRIKDVARESRREVAATQGEQHDAGHWARQYGSGAVERFESTYNSLIYLMKASRQQTMLPTRLMKEVTNHLNKRRESK